jgi:NADPH:quinone reductase-like Zn-dependent oxidoreductase
MIRTSGAVWDGVDLVVTDELSVREPGPGEVTVWVLASGICHSDLNVIDGRNPVAVPVVLGHEAAGIVDGSGRKSTRSVPAMPWWSAPWSRAARAASVRTDAAASAGTRSEPGRAPSAGVDSWSAPSPLRPHGRR